LEGVLADEMQRQFQERPATVNRWTRQYNQQGRV